MFNSKKTSLIILGITSIVCSRAMFAFFNDPEGPNLLVVIGMAVIIYALSLAIYLFYPSTKPNSPKKLLLMILLQIIIVTGFYFCLEKQGTSFVPVISVSTSTPVARPGKIDTGVEGIVTIGPTCPVERIPPDPKCANKPHPTTLIITSTVIGKNGGVLVKTDSQGYFSKELTPGTYTISAEQTSVLPRLSPTTFKVTPHNLTSLNLQFDSGIR